MNLFDHVVRKSLCLSLNEYCFLLEVYTLSKNIKYAGWCIKPKCKIGEVLDLGKTSAYKIAATLEEKGLIERNEYGHMRTTDDYNMIQSSRDVNILMNGDFDLIKIDSSKSEHLVQKMNSPSSESELGVVQKVNTSNNIYSNTRDIYKNHKKFNPPSEQQVVDFFTANSYCPLIGAQAFRYYDSANWTDSSGRAVVNWEQKMRGVWFKEENRPKKKESLFNEL